MSSSTTIGLDLIPTTTTDDDDDDDDIDVVDLDPEFDWNVNFDANFFAILAPTNSGSSSSVLSSTSIVLSLSTSFALPLDFEMLVDCAVVVLRVGCRIDVDVRGIRRDLATGVRSIAGSVPTTAEVFDFARLLPLPFRVWARGISSISSDEPLSG